MMSSGGAGGGGSRGGCVHWQLVVGEVGVAVGVGCGGDRDCGDGGGGAGWWKVRGGRSMVGGGWLLVVEVCVEEL